MPDLYKTFPPRWEHLRLPISSPDAALAGLALYAPCRPVGRVTRRAAWSVINVLGPRALPGPTAPWSPPMTDSVWVHVAAALESAAGTFNTIAVYERPQAHRTGFALLLVAGSRPVAFVKLRAGDARPLQTEFRALQAVAAAHVVSFRAPQPLALDAVDGWHYMAVEPLTMALHRPVWDPPLRAISNDVQQALASWSATADVPPHWMPMHGDLTPWNLRRTTRRELTLVDWEDVRFAPPGADVVLFRATVAALRGTEPPWAPAEAVEYWRGRLAELERSQVDRLLRRRLARVLTEMADRAPSVGKADGRPPIRRRRRVLLSAFGCHPDWGSEPEVGFRTLLAAAARCEVWLLTIPSNAAAVRAFLRGHELEPHVHVVSVPIGISDRYVDRVGLLGFHVLYDIWQRRVARLAPAMDRELDADLVHHVTVAALWARAGVAAVAKPLVWGPVGGAVEPPARLVSTLGLRGVLGAIARVVTRRILSRVPPSTTLQRRAAVIFAQNESTAGRVRPRDNVRVLSNATSVDPTMPGLHRGQRRRDVVFAGRLLAWKGGVLAVLALSAMRDRSVVLRVFGSGPDRRRMIRAARRHRIAHRVRFERQVPRTRFLAEVASAGVLLHPALHEEAGLVVAEALSLGTPVVCLDRGGPRELVDQWPDVPSRLVAPADPRTTARHLADAVEALLAQPPPVVTTARGTRPVTYEHGVLEAYDVVAPGFRSTDDVLSDRPRTPG